MLAYTQTSEIKEKNSSHCDTKTSWRSVAGYRFRHLGDTTVISIII